MKRTVVGLALAALLLGPAVPALALTGGEAKIEWVNAQGARLQAETEYRSATLEYQKNKTPENDQKVIAAAKAAMIAALDEAEAWIGWKRVEAAADSRVPAELKAAIERDAATNLAKVATLREEVNGVTTRLQVVAVFIKIIGSYNELVTDVARNTGAMWATIGERLETAGETYEAKLREVALARPANSELIAKLDAARLELAAAKSKIALAKSAYALVKLPGTPLLKFAEGNRYLGEARANLTNVQARLWEVFNQLSLQK